MATGAPTPSYQWRKNGVPIAGATSASYTIATVRASDADAALYWLARMLDGGVDPRYVARRVLRMVDGRVEEEGGRRPRAVGE